MANSVEIASDESGMSEHDKYMAGTVGWRYDQINTEFPKWEDDQGKDAYNKAHGVTGEE